MNTDIGKLVLKIKAVIDKDNKLGVVVDDGDNNSMTLVKDMKPFIKVTHDKVYLLIPLGSNTKEDEDNIKTLADADRAAFDHKPILICSDPARKDFMQAQAIKNNTDFADSLEMFEEIKAARAQACIVPVIAPSGC
jgi:hypothetical protein